MKEHPTPLPSLAVDTCNLSFPVGDFWPGEQLPHQGNYDWELTEFHGKNAWIYKWTASYELPNGAPVFVQITNIEVDVRPSADGRHPHLGEQWWARVNFEAGHVRNPQSWMPCPLGEAHEWETAVIRHLMHVGLLSPYCPHNPGHAIKECADPQCFMAQVTRTRLDLALDFAEIRDPVVIATLLKEAPQARLKADLKGSVDNSAWASTGKHGMRVKVYPLQLRHPGAPEDAMRVEQQLRKAPLRRLALQRAGTPLDPSRTSEIWIKGAEWSGVMGCYGGLRSQQTRLETLHPRSRHLVEAYRVFKEAAVPDPAWPAARQRRAWERLRGLELVPGLPESEQTGLRRRLDPYSAQEVLQPRLRALRRPRTNGEDLTGLAAGVTRRRSRLTQAAGTAPDGGRPMPG